VVQLVLVGLSVVGLTVSLAVMGGVHFQLVWMTLLLTPVKLKLPLTQALVGTKMLTVLEPLGESVPLVGVKMTPLKAVLADQVS
jgi:hypothetical protein